MNGEVVHFEIPCDDLDRARKFYNKTFGWSMEPMPEVDYTLVKTTESDENGRPKLPGAIDGGLLLRQAPVLGTVITIRVDNIEKAAKTIVKNGGKILQKKAPIADGAIGFAAYFSDSEGNTVGLFERAPR
jgi:predicted enzyme related to lactoylglutathione lyase